MIDAEALLCRAMTIRTARGLKVETTLPDGRRFISYRTDPEDRDAYMTRCADRGEAVRILED